MIATDDKVVSLVVDYLEEDEIKIPLDLEMRQELHIFIKLAVGKYLEYQLRIIDQPETRQ